MLCLDGWFLCWAVDRASMSAGVHACMQAGRVTGGDSGVSVTCVL